MSGTDEATKPLDLSSLAREIAKDLRPLDEILAVHGVTEEQFEDIRIDPRFDRLLQSLIAEWSAAENTAQRVAVKSAALVEEALPVLYRDIVDSRIPLAQRVEGLKLASRLGKLGENDGVKEGAGSGFSIKIILGEDRALTVDATPRQVIEGDLA